MKKIMNILFLSCLKASELIEKKLHLKLSRKEKIKLNVHKAMCKACTLYEHQSEFLEKGIAKHLNKKPEEIDSQQLKKQITEKISSL